MLEFSEGLIVRSKSNIFESGSEFDNGCSEAAKIYTTIMLLADVPSRVIWMNGHTVAESFINDKWVLVDVFANLRAHNFSGEELGILDVIDNCDSVKFSKIIGENYEYLPEWIDKAYLSKPSNVYSNQNLLIVINQQDIYSFHEKTRNFRLVLNTIFQFQSNAVGRGFQFVIDDYHVGNFGWGLIKRFYN
jgi:hypothetical protein